jgi:hypothetical protein
MKPYQITYGHHDFNEWIDDNGAAVQAREQTRAAATIAARQIKRKKCAVYWKTSKDAQPITDRRRYVNKIILDTFEARQFCREILGMENFKDYGYFATAHMIGPEKYLHTLVIWPD